MTTDEGIRPDSSVETLAKLKPAFRPENGKVTAGNSSQITDGASGVLIMSEARARRSGSPPGAVPLVRAGRDRPRHDADRTDPATRKIIERAGLTLDDIDLIEINEAFASVRLAWAKEFDADIQGQRQRRRDRARPPAWAHRAPNSVDAPERVERTNGRYGLHDV